MLNAIDTGNMAKIQLTRGQLLGYSLHQVETMIRTTFPGLDVSSSLWVAVLAGYEEVGLYLIAEGADVNQVGSLHSAHLVRGRIA